MRHHVLAASCLAAMTGSAVLATEHNTPVDLDFVCNQHGAVVRTPSGSTYYIGNSCDASQPGVGDGRWWTAAAAFIIEINGQSIRFANDIPCKITYCLP